MGSLTSPQQVKLFMAIMHTSDFPVEELHEKLASIAGAIEEKLSPYSFIFTDYYSEEMGDGLRKYFVSFEKPMNPEYLIELKLSAVELENHYSTGGSRRVNIDPGYVCPAKVVLSTSKDYSHRLYLGKGIFGDVHLQYRKNEYISNPWTYADYKQPAVLEFLIRIRTRLMKQLARME